MVYGRFWTVQFTGVQGFGAGVLTLIKGQVFGGDSGMLYTGTYSQQGSAVTARVHVERFSATPAMHSVMGPNTFDLDLTGTLQGNTATISGVMPGTTMRLTAALTKRADLPARA